MPVRKVITVDEEKCDGCGQCVPSCAEGAIQVIDGKARLVSETYCDGLGACLGDCPQGAILLEERQADDFDPAAVEAHLARLKQTPETPVHPLRGNHGHSGCPGSLSQTIIRDREAEQSPRPAPAAGLRAHLSNWPVQLHLVPVQAPYFAGADLLIAADCAPFAFADFHSQFLAGKKLIIGCPKLDDTSAYLDKLVQIFSLNDIRSVEVAFMEVPCCFGLVSLVQQAVSAAGKRIPVSLSKLGIRGDMLDKHEARSAFPLVTCL
ncbi:MAG: 4Fe-4S binding protein [Acidobacteriota bacterium]